MSQQGTEERLADVEKAYGKLSSDFRVMSHDLAGVKADVTDLKTQGGQILGELRSLANKAASQPSPITGKGAFQMVGSIGVGLAALASVIWFIIQISPSVSSLGERLGKLDDPEIGKVISLSDRVRRLEDSAGVAPLPHHRPTPSSGQKSQVLSLPF